ncbi:MAG: hypothetical protein SFZ03_09950 [Candidatus Melainabacteria bacterium]|nr:hypothetical protein [Candidatus Melainabacteria bacterium]
MLKDYDKVQIENLKVIPYLNADALQGRVLLLMPFWDGQEWHQWFLDRTGGVIKTSIVDVVKSIYVAQNPALGSDLLIPFVAFMWQRANWPKVSPLISAICDDFHHIAISIAKLRHFFDTKNTVSHNLLSSFVATELEYILILSRSIFDLLQEAISTVLYEYTRFNDPNTESLRTRHRLPGSFSKMILYGQNSSKPEGTIRTIAEIQEKYALTPLLAAEYLNQAPFFLSLRTARDKVVHDGKSLFDIYVTEKGFCVSHTEQPFVDFGLWESTHQYNEHLVSLFPWIAHLVFQTIAACNDMMEAFAREIRFPDEIAPGYQIFIRDPANEALIQLYEVHQRKRVWWAQECNEL